MKEPFFSCRLQLTYPSNPENAFGELSIFTGLAAKYCESTTSVFGSEYLVGGETISVCVFSILELRDKGHDPLLVNATSVI